MRFNTFTALCCFFYAVSLQVHGQSSDIANIKQPTPKERTSLAGIISLPKVSSREVKLTAEQQKKYSQFYGNYKFEDQSRYVRGIPLGITGIHAVDSTKRQDLFVYLIEENSPAFGKVQVNDMIVGANGRLFEGFRDCRIIMGLSIAESQSSELKGKLGLHIMRGGKFGTITIDIGTETPYAKTFPFNCQRSKKMADAHIKLLLTKYAVDSKMEAEWWNVLMLMASEDQAAQELTRRAIHQFNNEPNIRRLASWYLGYELIMLCEYYLLTGDSSVLPKIQKWAQVTADGQCPSGSWGHGLGLGGYGEVNATGLTCFLGLVLAKKCGVKVDPVPYNRSLNFFKQFKGGIIPYGAHVGKPYQSSNNGKGGMAAVIFDILGDKETSREFATPTCYSYHFREGGHAEGIFNFAWGPLGAVHASPEEFQLFMKNHIWYYELSRRTSGNYDYFRSGRFDETKRIGGMGLFLMMSGKKLQILGAEPSVFSLTPPKGAEEAAQYFKEKKWSEFVAASKSAQTGSAGNYVSKLKEAYKRMSNSADATQQLIKKNIAAKDMLTARVQYDALENQVGKSWPGMKDLEAQISIKTAALKEELSAYSKEMRGKRRAKNRNRMITLPKGYKSTRDRRKVILNGWTPGTKTVAAEISKSLQKLPISEVIRYTVHPYQLTSMAAINEAVLRKSESKPLVVKLLNHSDPAYRASAVRILGAYHLNGLIGSKRLSFRKTWSRQETREGLNTKLSDDMKKSFDLIKHLVADKSEEVQMALTDFLDMSGLTHKMVDEILLELMKSKYPKVLTKALKSSSSLVKDPQAVLKISLATLEQSELFVHSEVGSAANLIVRQRDLDLKPYLGTIIKYLETDAFYRKGMFADGSYVSLIKMLQKYPDAKEVQESIPLLCRFYTRKHFANFEVRTLFENMDKKLVIAEVKKFIPQEEKWLNDITKNNLSEFKDYCYSEDYSRACLEELTRLSNELQTEKQINQENYDRWVAKLKFGKLMKKSERDLRNWKNAKKKAEAERKKAEARKKKK